MTGDRWTETCNALVDVAEYAFELCVHTVSMCFMNDPTYVRGLQVNVLTLNTPHIKPDILKGSSQLKSIFNRLSPDSAFIPLISFPMSLIMDDRWNTDRICTKKGV